MQSVAQFIRDITLPLFTHRAKKYNQIMNSAHLSGVDLEKTQDCLAYFLDKSGMTLDKDVLGKVSQDDFVEIYDRFAVQIFRSFNLFHFSTFDREILFEKRMDQLYERPEFYNQILFKAAYKVLARKTPFLTGICPSHIVQERKDNPARVEIGYKFMAPVYDGTGSVIGVLVCETLKLLSNGSDSPSKTRSGETV